MAKADKDMLRELGQLATVNVFDPLTKQSDTGVVTGLKKDTIEEWYSKKVADLKATALFKGADDSKLALKK